MTTVSPPIPSQFILDCGETPLATTANIVGILTFALGLLASYIALQSATRGAPAEIARVIDELRSTQSEINRVAEYIFDDAHHDSIDHAGTPARRFRFLADANSPYNSSRTAYATNPMPLAPRTPLTTLYAETQALLSSCIRLFYETDRLLKRSQSDSSRWDPEGLRRRIVFVMNRHALDEKIQRLAEQKQKLGGVQMTLFMRRSVLQEGMLTLMGKKLEGLEKAMVEMGGWRGRGEVEGEEDLGLSAG